MKKGLLKRLWIYVGKYSKYLWIALFCAFLTNILALTAPLLIGKAIDNIWAEGEVNFKPILNILIILISVYIFNSIFQWFLSVLINKVSNGTIRDLRQDAFNKISALPLSYLDNKSSGDIISRLTNDIDSIADGLLQGITQLFSGIIIIVGALIFMFRLSSTITLVIIVMTPVSFWLASFIAKRSNKMFREQSKTLGELNGYIEEMIGNHKIIKAFNYEEKSQDTFKEINARLYECGRKAQFYSSLTNPGTRFINNISYVFCGVIGGIVVLSGTFTIGELASFLTYATQFSRPVNEITSVSTQIQAAIAAVGRVFEIIDSEAELKDIENAKELKDTEGKITFKNVDFSYTKDSPLIENLNLDIKPGSTVAIVGPTGAGKTTMVNLLMKFYNINNGEILIDDENIETLTKSSLRKSFGMVLQESWLFNGTIRENLLYGRPEASEEEMIKAAKEAKVHGFISRLPQGYDTIIHEDGGNLSQGQKQLLTIARVMLADPPMLILDEATSSIDTRTEEKIQKAFLAMMKGRTSFVIAHRLSTIRDADLILFMNKGTVVEKGNHHELLEKKGFYYNLYNSQFAKV